MWTWWLDGANCSEVSSRSRSYSQGSRAICLPVNNPHIEIRFFTWWWRTRERGAEGHIPIVAMPTRPRLGDGRLVVFTATSGLHVYCCHGYLQNYSLFLLNHLLLTLRSTSLLFSCLMLFVSGHLPFCFKPCIVLTFLRSSIVIRVRNDREPIKADQDIALL